VKDYLNPDAAAQEDEAIDAIRLLAADLTCDRGFIRVLKDCRPALRADVYKKIRPFVGYPDPRPFELMSFDCDA
jgi:hypothetical protein